MGPAPFAGAGPASSYPPHESDIVTDNSSTSQSSAWHKHGPLRVHPNNRYLQHHDGTPFFYLADTAWELFHRLTLDEADRYLRNREGKGFTVIQAVALSELDGTDVPNANGDLPLIDGDPTKPNEAYFAHVDAIVACCAKHGLVMGMLPCWGRYWKQSENKRANPGILNADNAGAYARFLGERYREAPVIWILGGDRNIDGDDEMGTIEAMATGLREADQGSHLITFHPCGPGQSSAALHDKPWLDFNMNQSSHAAHDHDNGLYIEHDLALHPPKPTLDGEPRYECIPVGFYFDGANRLDRFDDADARQAAWWAVLAGACGHTYGNNNIWQMYDTGRTSILWADIPWHEAIHHPGSRQVGLMKRLLCEYDFTKLRAAQDVLADAPAHGGARVRAAMANDGSFAFVYSPYGAKFTVVKDRIKAARIRCSWFDPRYGVRHVVHTGDTRGLQTYSPPTSGRGNDWVLILEDDAL